MVHTQLLRRLGVHGPCRFDGGGVVGHAVHKEPGLVVHFGAVCRARLLEACTKALGTPVF